MSQRYIAVYFGRRNKLTTGQIVWMVCVRERGRGCRSRWKDRGSEGLDDGRPDRSEY